MGKTLVGDRLTDVRAELRDRSVWAYPIHGGKSVDEFGVRAQRAITGPPSP